VAGNDSMVKDSGSSTIPASTAAHCLTRDPPAPRMGSRASSYSPQDPPPVQFLQEAVNCCLRRPLRVLGFDLNGQKFGRYGRLFIVVSVLSRRGFDREAVLILQLNSFPHWLGLTHRGRLPARYEFGMNSAGLLTPDR
jgi:hypothetical protein